MAEINGIKVPFIPIERYDDLSKLQKISPKDSFQSIFQQEVDTLKFTKIQSAVDKAQSKGSKDSLVMMDRTAFIVNIPNRTVVTAVPVGEDNENVFTNIDSVVFA